MKNLLTLITVALTTQASFAQLCGSTLTGSSSLNADDSCSSAIEIDGGTLVVNAHYVLSANLSVVDEGKLIITNNGHLEMGANTLLTIDDANFYNYGKLEVHDVRIASNSTFITYEPIHASGNWTQSSSYSRISDSLILSTGTLSVGSGSTLYLADSAQLELTTLTQTDNGSSIILESGAQFISDYLQLLGGNDLNNSGYIELNGLSNNGSTLKVNITGEGVAYVKDKKSVQLKRGSKIHSANSGNLKNDLFVCQSDTIRVKRMKSFKVPRSGMVLGNELTVEDSLDLNGYNIDIRNYNLKLKRGKSYHRNGVIDEYIKTSSSGKFKLIIEKNKTEHIAPIGRNPYLPVSINCDNCEGVEFSIRVTQNVHENPETQTNQLTTNAVGETWSIIPSQSFAGNVTISLQWNAGANSTVNSELAGFDRTDCSPSYWIVDSSSSWNQKTGSIGISASGSDPYSVSITLSEMIGEREYFFGVGSSPSPLPVELSSFEGRALKGESQLEWITQMEKNCQNFIIQRSFDGHQWEEIGRQGCTANSNSKRYYKFNDENPQNGINYYRLRQVDIDGTAHLSKIISVHHDNNLKVEMRVFPNPSNGRFQIDLKDNKHNRAIVMNSSGQLLKEIDLSSNQVIDLTEQEAGIYFLCLPGSGLSPRKLIRK